MLPKSFYEAKITLISKPDTDNNNKKEDYRLISLVNIDAKILKKVLANEIPQYIKRIIHQQSATFLAPGTGFVEDDFSMDRVGWGWGVGWFRL